MASDDFTFPTTVESFHSPVDSPPLWLLSPSISPGSPEFGFRDRKRGRNGAEDDDGEDYSSAPLRSINYDQRKSFSYAEMTEREERGEKEEKMDMLWEGFNEDLRRSRSLKLSSVNSFDDQKVQIGCVRGFRRPKTSSAVIPTKKTTVVAIVKLLRKLFVLHNSGQKLKTHQW